MGCSPRLSDFTFTFKQYGRCCQVAGGECIGKVSKMIIQKLVAACIKCITLYHMWMQSLVLSLTSTIDKIRPSFVLLPPSKKTVYLKVPEMFVCASGGSQ